MSSLEVVSVEQFEVSIKFSELRGCQYVVTLVRICGDPHYTSCTNPRKFFLEMSSECSCCLGRIVRAGRKWVK